MYCKMCGRQLTSEDIYCPACGCRNSYVVKEEKDEKIFSSYSKMTHTFWGDNKIPIIGLGCLLFGFLIFISVQKYQDYKLNKVWREYKSAYAISDISNNGSIDFSNLHKYSNSTYKIGTDMPAGEYVIFANSGSGYFCLSEDSSGDSIICNDNFEYNSIITVKDGEYLELSRCYAEPISTADSISVSGTGMFKIGTHLSAGEYKLEATDTSGYFCVYNDGRQDDISNNDNFEGTAYVTVRNGQYLELSRCKIVK